MTLNSEVMRGDLTKICLVIVILTLECGWGSTVCERGKSWWDRERGACVPCTKCDPARKLAVRFPCQLHRDTVCHSLNNIRFWLYERPKQVYNVTKEPSEVASEYEYDDDTYVEVSSAVDNTGEGVNWKLQVTTMTLAASGCVVFFIVVIYFTVYHAKQWRKLRQVLYSDVQKLTAKLKLIELGIEDDIEQIAPNEHHIYCNIHVGKEALLGSVSGKKGLGNVYTQEKL